MTNRAINVAAGGMAFILACIFIDPTAEYRVRRRGAVLVIVRETLGDTGFVILMATVAALLAAAASDWVLQRVRGDDKGPRTLFGGIGPAVVRDVSEALAFARSKHGSRRIALALAAAVAVILFWKL